MPTMQTPQDFKAFDRLYSRIKGANREARLDAVGLLTPKLLKQHLKSGQDLVLAYGRRGETVTYTLADLKQFDDAIKRSSAEHKSSIPGVPLLQLEAMSLPVDKERAAKIRSAMFYRISGNVLQFQVTASPDSKVQHHQVKIRLDSWEQRMLDAPSFSLGAKQAAVGNISFDCTCGRHQYWYRYLATLGKFALAPLEKDFPKIRNPKLTGCCCKHVLRVLKILKSANIHGILAKEMERQAGAIGYMERRAKFLSKTDLAKAKAARGTDKDTAEAKRAYKQFRQAGKAFRRKLAQGSVKDELARLDREKRQKEAENVSLRKQVTALQKQSERKSLGDMLVGAMAVASDLGLGREEVFSKFAAKNNLPVAEIEQIAKERGL